MSHRLVISLLALAACSTRPISRPPEIPRPSLPPDAFIAVEEAQHEDEVTVEREVGTRCVTGTAHCVTDYRTGREQVTVRTARATVEGQPLTRAQLEVLVDDDRPAKLGELDRIAGRCRRGRPLAYVGGPLAGLAIGAGPPLLANGGTAALTGAALLGAAVVTLGGAYMLGAFECGKAADLRERLDLTKHQHTTWVEGDEAVLQIKALADRFNRRHTAQR